jgi:hypothetical protein
VDDILDTIKSLPTYWEVPEIMGGKQAASS